MRTNKCASTSPPVPGRAHEGGHRRSLTQRHCVEVTEATSAQEDGRCPGCLCLPKHKKKEPVPCIENAGAARPAPLPLPASLASRPAKPLPHPLHLSLPRSCIPRVPPRVSVDGGEGRGFRPDLAGNQSERWWGARGSRAWCRAAVVGRGGVRRSAPARFLPSIPPQHDQIRPTPRPHPAASIAHTSTAPGLFPRRPHKTIPVRLPVNPTIPPPRGTASRRRQSTAPGTHRPFSRPHWLLHAAAFLPSRRWRSMAARFGA
jgi:hypothetical protein